MPFLLVLIFSGLCFSQNLHQFELEERVQPEDSAETQSGTWMMDGTSNDTLEYTAIDLEYNVLSKTFNLNNKAQLKYRTATLNGDTIIYSQKGKTIEVIGNPVFREASQPSLASYKMRYNLDTKVGEIVYGTSYMDNQQFNGMLIRAVTIQSEDTLKEQRFLIERGDFSTCTNPEHQHYSFFSRRMVMKPKESVTARPVVLNMGEVPVAVLPMMVSPLKSGRRSGLLTPKFGGDQAQGFFMNNLGFYYAPNDYLDNQLYADILEGSEADFTKSSLTNKFVYNKLYTLDGYLDTKGYLNDGTIWRDYDIKFHHYQRITPDASKTLTGDGEFVSRANLRRENGIDEETVLNQQANAYLTYKQKIGDNKDLTIKTSQEYNLQTGLIERQNPDITFTMSGPLFSPDLSGENIDPPFWENIDYRNNFRFNNYMRRAPSDTIFYDPQDSTNFSVPDTTAYYVGATNDLNFSYNGLRLFDVLTITPSINFNGLWSAKEKTAPHDSVKISPKDTVNGKLDDRSKFAFDPSKGEYGEWYLKGKAELDASTKLYGTWRPEWGRFTGIRHTISPSVGYTYAPELDTNYTFASNPELLQTPFQAKEQTVRFGLSNNFSLKYLTANVDTLSEDTDPDDYSKNLNFFSTNHSTSYNFAADSFQWSIINSTFGIQLMEDYMFSITTYHDFYHRFENNPKKVRIPQLTYWGYGFSRRLSFDGNFNAGLPSKKGKYENKVWNASVDYQYSFSSTRIGKALFRDDYDHYAMFNVSLYPSRKWNLQYSSQYNFEEAEFTSHSLQFYRDLHCWKMDFTWRPTGAAPGWSFAIYIVDLPDVRLSASNTEE